MYEETDVNQQKPKITKEALMTVYNNLIEDLYPNLHEMGLMPDSIYYNYKPKRFIINPTSKPSPLLDGYFGGGSNDITSYPLIGQ